jgi:hypothetical protein
MSNKQITDLVWLTSLLSEVCFKLSVPRGALQCSLIPARVQEGEAIVLADAERFADTWLNHDGHSVMVLGDMIWVETASPYGATRAEFKEMLEAAYQKGKTLPAGTTGHPFPEALSFIGPRPVVRF